MTELRIKCPLVYIIQELISAKAYKLLVYCTDNLSYFTTPKSEVAIRLCFQLCSDHYMVLQTKNSMRSFSAINPVAMENIGNKHDKLYHATKGSP